VRLVPVPPSAPRRAPHDKTATLLQRRHKAVSATSGCAKMLVASTCSTPPKQIKNGLPLAGQAITYSIV